MVFVASTKQITKYKYTIKYSVYTEAMSADAQIAKAISLKFTQENYYSNKQTQQIQLHFAEFSYNKHVYKYTCIQKSKGKQLVCT